jgi:septal ring factor EnvC (AmiA/AmiB activator)
MRRFALVSGALVIAVMCQTHALTQPNNARDLAQDAAERLTELQREADRLAKQTTNILSELRLLDVQRQIKTQELAKADTELKQIVDALDIASARVAALEAERQAEAPWIQEQMVAVYRRGRAGYLQLLLTADDLKSVGRMTRGLAAIVRLDRMRLETHRRTIRDERAALSDLQTRRAEADQARAATVRARQAFERAVAANNRRLDELDIRRDLAARYIGDLQSAQTELQRSVSALPSGAAVMLPIEPFKGTLDWPAEGAILSRFGRNLADRFGSTILRNGIEIKVTEDAPVRAVHAGTVAYAAPFTGFGTLVIVDHGRGAFTLYGHLSQALVTNGAKVGRNDIVGRAGRTPTGTPAAYFELRVDGRPVDPVQWLRSPR